MNEKIKQLAEQAGSTHKQNLGVYQFYTDELEKFAELIIRECCDWIEGSPTTDANQLLLTKSFIIANLKEHFGVEE
jgi:hypothetical protein